MSKRDENICALIPIAAGRGRELEAQLGNIPSGEQSPFAGLEGTHFARFQIVPNLLDSAGDQLDATSYLLFATEFDGPTEPYLDALCTELADRADAIWGNCVGYPGAEALKEYLLEHRIKPGYSVLGYEGATVAEIRDGLELEDRLVQFSIEARGLDAEALQAKWRTAFAGDER